MVQKAVGSFTKQLPSQEELEHRFIFIDKLVLRTNLAISLRYVVFLVALEAEIKLPGVIIYSLYKDIVLHTTSIVESTLNFTLNKMIEKGKISKSCFPSKWTDIKSLDVYPITKTKKVCGVIKQKKYEKINSNTQFKTLNEIALKSKLINKNIFEKLDELRIKRNHIHLAPLETPDTFYTKEDVNQTFKTVSVFLRRMEKKIIILN